MKKRYLIERHPELIGNSNIPITYHYMQLYTSIITDNDGAILRSIYGNSFFKTVEVDVYQTKKFLPKRVFYKPITRNFEIKNKEQQNE